MLRVDWCCSHSVSVTVTHVWELMDCISPCEKPYVLPLWDLCHLITGDAGESNLWLSQLFYIYPLLTWHPAEGLKWKKQCRAVVITSVAFLIKRRVFVFAEQNCYLLKLESNSNIEHFSAYIHCSSFFYWKQTFFFLHSWYNLCVLLFSRCAVSVETLDVPRSLLWRANCMEPKVLRGWWLSDAASEWGGGGESRQYYLSSVMSVCVAIVILLVCSSSSFYLSSSVWTSFPSTHFSTYCSCIF